MTVADWPQLLDAARQLTDQIKQLSEAELDEAVLANLAEQLQRWDHLLRSSEQLADQVSPEQQAAYLHQLLTLNQQLHSLASLRRDNLSRQLNRQLGTRAALSAYTQKP